MRVWEGVAPARVTAHNDPKKMGRLRVQLLEGRRHAVGAHGGAARRSGPVATQTRAFSREGKSVVPKHAAFISITQYGPGHRYLRENQAINTP